MGGGGEVVVNSNTERPKEVPLLISSQRRLFLHGGALCLRTMTSFHLGSKLDMNPLLIETGKDCLSHSPEERVWRRLASMTGLVLLSSLLLVVTLIDLQPRRLSQRGSLEVVLETKGREEDERVTSLEFTELCVVDQPVLGRMRRRERGGGRKTHIIHIKVFQRSLKVPSESGIRIVHESARLVRKENEREKVNSLAELHELFLIDTIRTIFIKSFKTESQDLVFGVHAVGGHNSNIFIELDGT
jgi:hypothetical protein